MHNGLFPINIEEGYGIFSCRLEIKNIFPRFAPLKFIAMSRVCQLTGKRPLKGNHVSHSNVKTKRRFYPNLQEKKFYIPELKKWVVLRISTSAMRTINKKGLLNYIREIEKKEGKKLI